MAPKTPNQSQKATIKGAPSLFSSQARWIGTAAYVFGTIWVGFGINALVRPDEAITFFEIEAPTVVSSKVFFDVIMAVYATRDIFVGLALYASELYGSRKATGLILLASSALAYADGVICKVIVGKGEWNHWGYAPMITAVGVLAVGALDNH
jgi:hypothetical protein